MRHRQKKNRDQSKRTVLRHAVSIVSAIATIIGTIVGILDTLHRW